MSSPEKISGSQSIPNTLQGHSMGLEALLLLVHASKLKNLETQLDEKYPEVKENQEDIQLYHLIEAKINSELNANGELEGTKFDQILAETRKELKDGLEIKLEKSQHQEMLKKRF